VNYTNGRPTAAASCAHEILHLFGMGELYFPYDKDDRRKKIAKRMFPHDIMRRIDYNMAKMKIGTYTACRVGWIGKLDPEHGVFEDPEEVIRQEFFSRLFRKPPAAGLSPGISMNVVP
jgi:hypothetical protein